MHHNYEAISEYFKNMNFTDFVKYSHSLIDNNETDPTYEVSKDNILLFIDDLDKVKFLVEQKNLSQNIVSPNYSSVLFYKNPEVTEYYYQKGVSILSPNSDDESPLSVASLETTKKLFELGVTVDYRVLFQYTDAELLRQKIKFLMENFQGEPHELFDEQVLHHSIDRKFLENVLFKDIEFLQQFNDYFNSELTDHNKGLFLSHYLLYFRDMHDFNTISSAFNIDDKNKEKIYDQLLLNLKKNKDFPLSADNIFQTLDMDIHNKEIYNKPWFFHFDLSEELLDVLVNMNVDVCKKDINNETWLFNIKEKFTIYPSAYLLSKKDYSFMLVKNNEDKNFLENYDLTPNTYDLSKSEDPFVFSKFISDTFYDHVFEPDFSQFIKMQLIFPSLAQGNIHLNSNNLFLPDAIAAKISAEFSEWEKNKIRDFMAAASPVPKNNSITRI